MLNGVETMIKACDITKNYARQSLPLQAVRHLSLELETGKLTAVTGKSGCGKTTLINLLGGLCPPDAGHIEVNGIRLDTLNRRQRADFRKKTIGFVFQSYDLLPHLTAKENILLPFSLNKETPDLECFSRLAEALELTDCLDAWPSQLSGGQQQRIAIARALIRKPAIVLADEPTGNLDRKSGIRVMKLLRECQQLFGQTILLVTHDLDLARQADRLLVMEDGEIIQDIRKQADVCEVFVKE